MFTGTFNTRSGGRWQTYATNLALACRGPCRRQIGVTIAGHGGSIQDLASANLPHRMTVIERAGKVIGIMCPQCAVPDD